MSKIFDNIETKSEEGLHAISERQANPANSEAIARVTGGRDAFTGREISASDNDRVHHWGNLFWRSDKSETENNDARDLFREAVFSMFGGKEKVPESVKTAMRLEDYDKGLTDTCQRILANYVVSDPNTAKLTDVHSGQTVEAPVLKDKVNVGYVRV